MSYSELYYPMCQGEKIGEEGKGRGRGIMYDVLGVAMTLRACHHPWG